MSKEWSQQNMERDREDHKARSTAHVLLLPYPAQGHINPMLEFGKRLAAHGLRATMAVTRFIARSTRREYSSVYVEQISDGCDAGGVAEAESIQAYLDGFKVEGSRTLTDLISGEAARGRPVRCVVYDPFMPWALDVAKGMGLLAAAFFTQTCAVNALYHQVYHGQLAAPSPGPTVSIDGLLEIGLAEAPSLISRVEYPAYVAMVVNQYSNLEKADAVVINTFYELEPKEADWMADLFPAKTIGPMVPSFYLDKPGDGDKHHGLDLCTSNTDACIQWLGSQETGSVVYVAFGSLSTLSAEQMEELAWGLTASGKRFLWVVRAPEMAKLPDGFAAPAAAEKGLLVEWCHQLDVLAHPAVGCFLTHCGWNSTLEGLSMGVPIVAVPLWTDQPTNARYVEAVWGTGVRARADETGVVRREEVASRIKEVTEGVRGEEIRENTRRWKKLAAEALADGGSSSRNIKEFVDEVVGRSETA